ncbi:uncharacterized protein LOC142349236 isoform X2 [Convolutriloba macropyga]
MAELDDVDCILFAFESSRKLFADWLIKTVNRYGSEKLKAKFKLVPTFYDASQPGVEDIAKYCPRGLEHAVLMIDELYSDCYFGVSKDQIQQVKCCWMAGIEAGQREILNRKPRIVENNIFNIESLHVLFRSAHHISQFSHNFLERQNSTFVSSAIVPGCFTSSQHEFKIEYFQSLSDKILIEESFQHSSYGENRLFIVFIDKIDDKNQWLERLMTRKDFNPACVCFCGTSGLNLEFLPFTGCEFMSVLIIIDLLEFKDTHFHCFILAISRAQFEVCFLVNQKLETSEDWVEFLHPKESIVAKLCNQVEKGVALRSNSLIDFQWKEVLKLRDKIRRIKIKNLQNSLTQSSVLIALPLVILLGSNLASSLEISCWTAENTGKDGKTSNWTKGTASKQAKKWKKIDGTLKPGSNPEEQNNRIADFFCTFTTN